jgi:hypothetical protein
MPIAAISLGKLEKDDDILTVFERLRVTMYSISHSSFDSRGTVRADIALGSIKSAIRVDRGADASLEGRPAGGSAGADRGVRCAEKSEGENA